MAAIVGALNQEPEMNKTAKMLAEATAALLIVLLGSIVSVEAATTLEQTQRPAAISSPHR
jgi:hypothetical protein